MDAVLLQASTKARPLLLSIPASELGSGGTIASPQKKQQTPARAGQLLLLQLPVGCRSPRQIRHFVGGSGSGSGRNGSGSGEHNGGGSNSTTTAALIVNDQSYSVHRVETSNTLLLIPPASTAPMSTTAGNTNTAPLRVHRLGGGAVSASFLELRRHYLHVSDVIAVLPVWDPFANNSETTTISTTTADQWSSPPPRKPLRDMALSLQSSEKELHHVLDQVLDRAVAFESEPVAVAAVPNNENDDDCSSYALITEQVQQICATAIVATLAEDEEYSYDDRSSRRHGGDRNKNDDDDDDDALMDDGGEAESSTLSLLYSKPVRLEALVEKSLARIIPSERFPHMTPAVRHVIRKSFATVVSGQDSHKSNNPTDQDTIILDWAKVREKARFCFE
jgi:Sister chromatid cohesion protein Dcc1